MSITIDQIREGDTLAWSKYGNNVTFTIKTIGKKKVTFRERGKSTDSEMNRHNFIRRLAVNRAFRPEISR